MKQVWYGPRLFVNATLDKASAENERNAIWPKTDDGKDVVSVQVAGLLVRRILCYVEEGDQLEQGPRYGFIRFGSRVEIFLPEDFSIALALGDNASSGSSILRRSK